MRRPLLALVLAGLAACAPPETKPSPAPTPQPLGEEVCDNRVDDDGDGKTDCADPSCFEAPPCASTLEHCGNALDDDGDGLIDCADDSCAASVACVTEKKEVCSGGVDDDGDGKTDCADNDCDQDRACAHAEVCGNGVDDDRDGVKDCDDPDCSAHVSCPRPEICDNQVDDDADKLVDCQDPVCEGQSCREGCTCRAGAARETSCFDNQDNDRDGRTDCSDPDCAGVGTELCGDGRDNNCNARIDCADPACAGEPTCALLDGQPCKVDAQCKGGKCLTESESGNPRGACSNQVSCNVSAQTGCAGGICVESGSFDVCRMKCTGTGLTGPAACRAGYVCADTDLISTNANNYCQPLCDADSDCAGSSSEYGCNRYSKLCQRKERNLAKYGEACSGNTQCETGLCSSNHPGGYCFGKCSGTAKSCGEGGACYFSPSYGDNIGDCLKGCTSGNQCRPTPYSCQDLGRGSICWCRPVGTSCSSPSECCSGACSVGKCASP